MSQNDKPSQQGKAKKKVWRFSLDAYLTMSQMMAVNLAAATKASGKAQGGSSNNGGNTPKK